MTPQHLYFIITFLVINIVGQQKTLYIYIIAITLFYSTFFFPLFAVQLLLLLLFYHITYTHLSNLFKIYLIVTEHTLV
jgi:hypothetical protein